MGVFKAETHSGSIKWLITRGRSPAHSSPTLMRVGQVNPARCQPAAALIRENLSRQSSALEAVMPHSRFQGAGRLGSSKPMPWGLRRFSGMRQSKCSGSRPNWRIKAKVWV